MEDEKHPDKLEREETISDLDLPEGEAEAVKGGAEAVKGGRAAPGELTITKPIDKASP